MWSYTLHSSPGAQAVGPGRNSFCERCPEGQILALESSVSLGQADHETKRVNSTQCLSTLDPSEGPLSGRLL